MTLENCKYWESVAVCFFEIEKIESENRVIFVLVIKQNIASTQNCLVKSARRIPVAIGCVWLVSADSPLFWRNDVSTWNDLESKR